MHGSERERKPETGKNLFWGAPAAEEIFTMSFVRHQADLGNTRIADYDNRHRYVCVAVSDIYISRYL